MIGSICLTVLCIVLMILYVLDRMHDRSDRNYVLVASRQCHRDGDQHCFEDVYEEVPIEGLSNVDFKEVVRSQLDSVFDKVDAMNIGSEDIVNMNESLRPFFVVKKYSHTYCKWCGKIINKEEQDNPVSSVPGQVHPIKEGNIKKGGVNEAPKTPKPDIAPPAQRP